jgi:hypothetical protein
MQIALHPTNNTIRSMGWPAWTPLQCKDVTLGDRMFQVTICIIRKRVPTSIYDPYYIIFSSHNKRPGYSTVMCACFVRLVLCLAHFYILLPLSLRDMTSFLISDHNDNVNLYRSTFLGGRPRVATLLKPRSPDALTPYSYTNQISSYLGGCTVRSPLLFLAVMWVV